MEFEAYAVRASRSNAGRCPLEIVSIVTKQIISMTGKGERWETFENHVAFCETPEEAQKRLRQLQALDVQKISS